MTLITVFAYGRRLGFLFILVGSLHACGVATTSPTSPSVATLNIADIKPGDAKELIVGGKPIIVIKGTSEDAENLRRLGAFVFQPGTAQPLRLSDGNVVLAVIPITPYSQCRVEYIPRGKNKLLWGEESWLGGYHSPCHSEVFDLLGRQIRPGQYSPTHFPKSIGNLPLPKLRALSEAEIEISLD